MFLLRAFLFVSITFYFVSTEHNDWFKKENSGTAKLIELNLTITEEFIYHESREFFATYEVKENGTLKRFNDLSGHQWRKLNFSNLKIEEIQPGAFKSYHFFSRLIMSDNKIKKIENGVFNNIKDLNFLDLSNNEISVIEDGAFDNMPDIMSLYLTNNKIVKLNGNCFKNSPVLTIIMFDDNEIEEISADSLKNFRGVRMFYGKQVGIYFYFDGNKINKIHQNAFSGISQIGSLNLRRNNLKELPENLFEGVIIEDLDIGENSIPCTPRKFFNATLRYKSNPPMCS